MCLDTITKQYKRSRKTVWAWKGFNGRTCLRTPIRKSGVLPRGVWIKAEQIELEAEDTNEKYMSGFHAYTLKDPSSFYGDRLVNVKLRGITAIGVQDYENVLVAREMFIPKQKKRKRA